MVTWTIDEFVEAFPTGYHMAEPGSWDGIRKHGLLSTSSLLDMFEVPEPQRNELEARRRPQSVQIHHPRFGTAVLRDQKPLSESKLAKCLTGGVTAEQWIRLLNR